MSLLLQWTFHPALSREFGSYKPNPAPLLHICSSWDVLPNEVIMIGDSLRDDVSVYFSFLFLIATLIRFSTDIVFSSPFFHTDTIHGITFIERELKMIRLTSYPIIQIGCGKGAGAFTCLLDETGRYNSEHFVNLDLEPDFKVSTLGEVLHLLDANFDLTP